MSETVSHRVRVLVGPSGRMTRSRPLPIGYGLLIAALLSIGLWVGLGVAMMRLLF